jgi:hypothetical protein
MTTEFAETSARSDSVNSVLLRGVMWSRPVDNRMWCSDRNNDVDQPRSSDSRSDVVRRIIFTDDVVPMRHLLRTRSHKVAA